MVKILQRLEEMLGLKRLDRGTVKGYKFVSTDMRSLDQNQTWEVDKWYMHDGKVSVGKGGFHASPDLYSAYENSSEGERLFEVEARGIVRKYDQFAAREMKLVREIDPRLSIDYAINCAKHVLPMYEKISPGDLRPRKAIEAAEAYLGDPSEQNKSAAGSAGNAAWSAGNAAWYPAWSAGHAAGSAAYAAWSAESAENAAESAENAAWSAEYASRFAIFIIGSADKEKEWQRKLLEGLIGKYYLK